MQSYIYLEHNDWTPPSHPSVFYWTDVFCTTAQNTCLRFAFCTWVALLWNVMGTDTGLMSACTPRAKCNYMLSQATIKKEAAVKRHSWRMVMQLTVFAEQGVRGKSRETWGGSGGKEGGLNSLWDRYRSSICQHWHFTIGLFCLTQFHQWKSSHAFQSVCTHPAEVWEIPRTASSGRKIFCGLRASLVCVTIMFKSRTEHQFLWQINIWTFLTNRKGALILITVKGVFLYYSMKYMTMKKTSLTLY